jgi:ABC-type enterochelin transport system substrate-binding protein
MANKENLQVDDSPSRVFVIDVGSMDTWDEIARSPKMQKRENNR